MSLLMKIPPEIRLRILEFVIEFSAPVNEEAPEGPSAEYKPSTFDFLGASWDGEMYEQYAPFKTSTALIPTLLVSRQLRSETLVELRRLELEKRDYVLDIMAVEECWLYSTWVYVPILTTQIEKLRVNLRIFGKKNEDFLGFCYEPEGLFQQLHNVLVRFLQLGPLPPSKNKRPKRRKGLRRDPDRQINIKVLEINVSSSGGYAGDVEPEGELKYWQLEDLRNRTGIDYVMHSGHLYDIIGDELYNELIAPTVRSDRELLYGRIGKIHLLLDGSLGEVFDIAVALQTLNALW